MKKPFFSALLVWLLPAYLIKVSLWKIPSNLLEIFIIFSFLILFFLNIKKFGKRTIQKSFQKIPFKYQWTLVILGFFATAVLKKDLLAGLGALKGWFLIPLTAVFLILLEKKLLPKKEQKHQLKFLLRHYFLATTIIVILAFFSASLEFHPLTFDHRLRFVYQSANMLAMNISIALVIGTSLITKKWKSQLWSYCGLAILLIGLLLTKSAGAIGALLIVLSVKIIAQKKFLSSLRASKRYPANKTRPSLQTFQVWKLTIVFWIFLLILFGSIFTYANYSYHHPPELHRQTAEASHFVVWRTSFHLLKDNFLWGVGVDQYLFKYLEYQKFYPPYPQWAIFHPHNIWLQAWLNGGFFAFIGFTVIVWQTSTPALKQIIKPIQSSQKGLPILSLIFLYLLIHGLVDNTVFKNDLAFWLFLSISFLYSAEKESKQTD